MTAQIRVAVVAVVLIMVGAACSGGGNKSVGTTTAPSSSAATATSAAPATSAALPSTGNSDIDSLLGRSRRATYHVVYEDGRGAEFEIYRDRDQLVLFSGNQAMYQLADGNNVACELGDQPVCNSLPSGGGSVDAVLSSAFGLFASVFAGAASETSPFANVTEITDETVAERPGRCAQVTLEERGYSVCIDAEIGILLRMTAEQTDGTTTEIAARKVEVDNVDQAIFDLPAPITG